MRNYLLNLKRPLLLLLLNFLLINVLRGQINNYVNSNMFLTPNQAELGKYVDQPVNMYNGVPAIDIPLMNVNINGITMPITMSYNAGGIKVSEIPGWTGLGWNLNAGGTILKIVRGYADKFDDANEQQLKRRLWFLSDLLLLDTIAPFSPSFSGLYPADWASVLGQPKEEIDSESDIYYYNFCGRSGYFVMDNDGNPMNLPASGIRIIVNNQKTFSIIDEQGDTYSFDTIGTTQDHSNPYVWSPPIRPIVWYLTKIQNHSNDLTVNLKYDRYWRSSLYTNPAPFASMASTFSIRSDQTFSYKILPDGSAYANPLVSGNGKYEWNYSYMSGQGGDFTTEYALNEIEYNGNRIVFNSNTNSRSDAYSLLLTGIYQYNSRDEMIGQVSFTYGYFNENGGIADKRLKLKKLLVNDKEYQFGYIENYLGDTLPPVTSSNTDLWGYYNGDLQPSVHGDGMYTVPHLALPTILSEDYGIGGNLQTYPSFPVAYKNPDYHYASLGTLNEIRLPTGGVEKLEYEGNDVSDAAYSGFKPIEAPEASMLRMDSVRQSSLSAASPYNGGPLSSQYAEKEIVIHHDQEIQILWSVSLQPPEDVFFLDQDAFNNFRDSFQFCGATVALYDNNDSAIIQASIPIFSITESDVEDFVMHLGSSYMITSGVLDMHLLKAGRYRMVCSTIGENMYSGINMQDIFRYKEGNNYYTGGLRVKQISFYDKDDSLPSLVQRYSYRQGGDSSTGVLESFPMVASGHLAPNAVQSNSGLYYYVPAQYYDFYTREIPLGSTIGGAMGYSSVTQTMNDSSKIVYHYTNGIMPDYGNMYGSYIWGDPVMFTTLRNKWYKRGLLYRTEYFDKWGGLVRLNKKHYRFDPYKNKEADYYDIIAHFRNNGGGLSDNSAGGSYTLVYPNVSFYASFSAVLYSQYAIRLDSDSTIDYTGNDRELTMAQTYFYDTSQLQPVKIISFRSDEDRQTRIENFYPASLVDSGVDYSGINSQLVAANIIAYPVKSHEFLTDSTGNTAFSSKKAEVSFKKFYSQYLLPSQTTAILNDGTPVSTVYNYDSAGHLVLQSNLYTDRQVYLWGYGGQYPVAKIVVGSDTKGKTVSQMQPLLTALTNNNDYMYAKGLVNMKVLKNAVSYTDGQLRTELNKLRTGWPDAQVYTYTYNPLFGMTSETDPRGNITYYEYDSYGRLMYARDKDGRILKYYTYNYQQPQLP